MQNIRKGDKVVVLAGKDAGKTSVVEKLIIKKGLAFLPGINTYKRHVKKQGQIEGGIIDLSRPLPISKVMLICPSCNKPTRIGYKIDKNKNTKVRICKKCGKEI